MFLAKSFLSFRKVCSEMKGLLLRCPYHCKWPIMGVWLKWDIWKKSFLKSCKLIMKKEPFNSFVISCNAWETACIHGVPQSLGIIWWLRRTASLDMFIPCKSCLVMLPNLVRMCWRSFARLHLLTRTRVKWVIIDMEISPGQLRKDNLKLVLQSSL